MMFRQVSIAGSPTAKEEKQESSSDNDGPNDRTDNDSRNSTSAQAFVRGTGSRGGRRNRMVVMVDGDYV